jgi:phage-related protein|tara:strand:- start:889 stop:1272 length:384 start_codon:yes stop_codon:yes gene_type:complete
MALGFSTGSSFGSRTIIPDKGMTRSNEPVIFKAEFGDGYQQRIANGINNLKQEFSVSFATREKAEIDDIIGFFESTNGVTAFDFTFADTNASGNEETVKVYVSQFTQNWDYDDFYTLSATFVRVYEA